MEEQGKKADQGSFQHNSNYEPKIHDHEYSHEANPHEHHHAEGMDEEPTLSDLSTLSLVQWFIGLLAGKAWESLGLVPNPKTNRLNKDLAEARLAIDTLALLVPILEGRVDARVARDLKAMLNDLRLNFVQQSSR